jgi:hypothetical protein
MVTFDEVRFNLNLTSSIVPLLEFAFSKKRQPLFPDKPERNEPFGYARALSTLAARMQAQVSAKPVNDILSAHLRIFKGLFHLLFTCAWQNTI